MKLSAGKEIVLIVLLCVLTRVPQLASENLLLDGDECVVALMAKHMIDGLGVPVYFYGQSYGFSLFEVAPIALSFLCFGVSDLAVKITMLMIWTLGVVFFYLALRRLRPRHAHTPLLVTLVLVCAPAWALWSLKARGGYLTAFLSSSIVLFLAFGDRPARRWPAFLVCGMLLALVQESQMLWLPGLLPIVGYRLWQSRSVGAYAGLVGGCVLGLTAILATRFLCFFVRFGALWQGVPGLKLSEDLGSHALNIPSEVFASFQGNYFLWHVYDSSLSVSAFALIMTVAVFGLLAQSGWQLCRRPRTIKLSHVISVSVVLTLSFPVVHVNYQARYLLPLTGLTLVLVFLVVDRFPSPTLRKSLLLPLALLGGIGCISFKDHIVFKSWRPQVVHAIVDHLSANQVRHAFVEDTMFQWLLVFYSDERIVTRTYQPWGRYRPYDSAVDAAFEDPEQKTALIGYRARSYARAVGSPDGSHGSPGVSRAAKVKFVGDYFVQLEPDRGTLQKHGFVFN